MDTILGAIYWDPSPIIVEIGSFPLRWYSSLFAVGFILSYIVLWFKFKKEDVDLDLLEKMLVYTVVGTVLGARLGYCVLYEPQMFVERPLEVLLPVRFHPEFEFVGFRGLASHGGTIGIILSFLILAWRTKRPVLWYLDKLALVTALGGAFIRFGNLMNSEILGEKTSMPWGFIFAQHPDPELAVVTLHPAQLYEAIGYLLLFGFMMWYYNRKFGKVGNGHILGLFLTLLFSIRFFVEFFKENYGWSEDSLINQGQLFSLPFIAVGVFLAWRYRTGTNDPGEGLPNPKEEETEEK